jgi:hypothetical protein
MAKKEIIGEVKLKNVRLSFESLFEPNVQTNEDGSERKTWKSNFLISKDKSDEQAQKNIKAIKAASAEVKEKKFGPETAKNKWPKFKADKVCFRDGDEENWDGYEGNWYLSCNSPLTRRPRVITNRKDKDGHWIEAQPGEKGCPYSGCYVNAIVRIWVQDNELGKRINASLEAVQFLRDGEPFGAGSIDVDDAFDEDDVSDYGDIDDDDDDDDDEEEDLI